MCVCVCVCVGCTADGGHLVLLFRKTILTEKISGLAGGINWFCRIIVPAKLLGGGEKEKKKISQRSLHPLAVVIIICFTH